VSDFPILSAIIAVPIIGSIVCLLVPERRPEIAKAVGYAATMITFGLAAWLLWHFEPNSARFQFLEQESWIRNLGVSYLVGVDGISIFMVAVTALLFPLGLLASERYITHRVRAYVAWFLLLEGAILGIFLALDLILFFVFWELMLVPMYFLILGWGAVSARTRP
jgi:NADH-quinone oxidoreductase subunit M